MNTNEFLTQADDLMKNGQQQQAEYKRAQHSASVMEPYDGGRVILRPISPFYDFFVLLFVAVGIYPFLYVSYVGFFKNQYNVIVTVGALLFGLYMIRAGIRGMFTYIRATEDGLMVLAPRLKPKRGRMGTESLGFPRKRTVPYAAISKATVETLAAGRGVGVGLKMTLSDGSIDVVNFGPFLRKDCRNLVLKMRSKGVPVSVLPGLLGRGFTN